MGSIIGGVIGGIGSLVGGNKAAKADMTGFNYLANSPIGQTYVPAGAQAVGRQGQIQGQEGELLGVGGGKSAFDNYLGSTGYNFQMDQGQRAITGSAAARGVLNSGSTAKALTKYGQDLASTTFNNYLGQLSSLNTQAAGTAQQGLGAGAAIGSAGTTGGANAGNAQQSGITSAAGQVAGTVANNWPKITNFFGGI